MTGGSRAVVVGFLVWVPPGGGEWLWLLLVPSLGGEGGELVMLGGVPCGEAIHHSLSVCWTQASARTHLVSLWHARFPSGCAVEEALPRGYSRLIGGHAGSWFGATRWRDACLYASDTKAPGGGTRELVGFPVHPLRWLG